MPRTKQRKRRLKGTGTIFRRAQDGLWVGRYNHRRGGIVERHYVYARTSIEADAALEKLRSELVGGADLKRADKLRIRDVVNTWLGDVQRSKRASTYERYRLQSQKIIDHVGDVKLTEVDADTVRILDKRMIAAEETPAARAQTRTMLSAALRVAVREQLLARNPVPEVPAPNVSVERDDALTLDEVKKLMLAASVGERLGAMYVLAVTSGLRLGELFGLQTADLDLDRGILRVQRSIREAHGGGITVSEPKTSAGRRIVGIPEVAVAALRTHLDRNGGGEYLFMAPKGGPLRKSVFTRNEWKPFLQRHQLPEWTMRQMRATAATLMHEAGVPVKAAQAMLGHTSADMTIGVYTRASTELQRQAVDRLNRLLSGAS